MSLRVKRDAVNPRSTTTQHLFASRVGDQVVGIALLVEDGPRARIARFHVGAGWRHTSIPIRLLRDVRDFCQQRGHHVVTMDASTIPRPLARVLDHSGFRLLSGSGPRPEQPESRKVT